MPRYEEEHKHWNIFLRNNRTANDFFSTKNTFSLLLFDK